MIVPYVAKCDCIRMERTACIEGCAPLQDVHSSGPTHFETEERQEEAQVDSLMVAEYPAVRVDLFDWRYCVSLVSTVQRFRCPDTYP